MEACVPYGSGAQLQGTPGLTCQVLPLLQKQPGAEGAASGGWDLTQLAMVT